MKRLIFLMLTVVFSLSTNVLYADESATIEGTIQGYQCVISGKTCPIGYEDPVAKAENLFVISTGDNDYYFVSNLDRIILARHLNEKVRVSGMLNLKYKSITANSLEYYSNGKWKMAWNKKMEEDALRELMWGNYYFH